MDASAATIDFESLRGWTTRLCRFPRRRNCLISSLDLGVSFSSGSPYVAVVIWAVSCHERHERIGGSTPADC